MSAIWSKTSRAVLRSLVPVICPPEAGHLADAIVDHMGLTLAASPAVLRAGLAAGLAGYDLGAIALHLCRAHKLTGERAERYFASWEHGLPPQQQLAKGINQLMSLSCYEMPEMMEACGYRPAGWIDEVSRKRLAVYGAEHEAQVAAIVAPDPLLPALAAHAARTHGGRHGDR